jgi:hypothetical protein
LGALDGTVLIGHDFVIGVHLREHAAMIPEPPKNANFEG